LFFLVAQLLKRFFAVQGLYTPALQLIVPVIEQASHLRQLCQITRHRIFYQLFRSAATRRGKLLQAGFCFGFQVYDHIAEFRDVPTNCQFRSTGCTCRQQLQVLRDLGLLEFLGAGDYRLEK
jgi:hypothetical protein